MLIIPVPEAEQIAVGSNVNALSKFPKELGATEMEKDIRKLSKYIKFILVSVSVLWRFLCYF